MPIRPAPPSPFQLYKEEEASSDYAVLPLQRYEAWIRVSTSQLDHLAQIQRREFGNVYDEVEASKEWWLLISSLFYSFVRSHAQPDQKPRPVPVEAIYRIAEIAEDLGNGKVPRIVQEVGRTNQGRPLWRQERMGIAYAVLYIEAADRGEILTRRARTEVKDCYDVSPETVRNWMRNRDEIVRGVPHSHLSPEQLTEQMHERGARYKAVSGRKRAKPDSKLD